MNLKYADTFLCCNTFTRIMCFLQFNTFVDLLIHFHCRISSWRVFRYNLLPRDVLTFMGVVYVGGHTRGIVSCDRKFFSSFLKTSQTNTQWSIFVAALFSLFYWLGRWECTWSFKQVSKFCIYW